MLGVGTVPFHLGRLRRLLEQPPLTLSVKGGGLPDEQSVQPAEAMLIERWEVESLVRLLERAEADTPHVAGG